MVNLRQFFKMKEITKDTVLDAHNQEPRRPRRRCFAEHTGIQQEKNNGSRSFSVKFPETIEKIFKADTGLDLFYSSQFKNHYRVVENDEELQVIKEWEARQGRRVFIRDCLSASIALDTNLVDNESRQYTEIGSLESRGKKQQDQSAITQLSDIVSQAINDLPYYKDADLICSIPPGPDKDFDLPSSVTKLVSAKVSKPDVTGGFVINRQKSSVKSAALDAKWNVWEDAQVSFQNSPAFNVNGKTIILIDDKYQSGITIQYIAMKLQQAGAHEVYGLSFVKTLRDTDNV